jgi:hypothetical protein
MKAAPASANVVDNFAFLEFLATNVGKGGAVQPSQGSFSPARGGAALATGGHNEIPVSQPANSSVLGPGPGPHVKKQLRRVADPLPGGQLAPLDHAHSFNGSSAGDMRKSHASVAQQELTQQRSLPSLKPAAGYHGAADEASRTVQRGRCVVSSFVKVPSADSEVIVVYRTLQERIQCWVGWRSSR